MNAGRMDEGATGTGRRGVRLAGVTRSHRTARGPLTVLAGVDLEIGAGRLTALVGRSGSGKTTVLQVAGLLLPPDSGTVSIGGVDAWAVGSARRAALRRSDLGFVFQSFNLLPQHSALRNVMLAASCRSGVAHGRALALLERVGLGDRVDHRPDQLSAGEQQRVALARALVNDPATVLADEPTGNLDAANERLMLSLLREVSADGRAVFVVTHSTAVAAAADSVLTMRDGRVVAADANPPAPAVAPVQTIDPGPATSRAAVVTEARA